MAAPAPVALFVYRRPEHTARMIASLKACEGFEGRRVIVFSDGPRDTAARAGVEAVRTLVAAELPRADIVAAPVNKGLAVSIIAGVTQLVEEAGRVIVVEDDLLLAPDFLTFLDAGLDRYAGDERVMQVSGHMFGVAVGNAPVLLPIVTTWGWATWRRAWAAFDPIATGSETLDSDPATRRKFNLDDAYDYFGMLKRQRLGQVDSWGIRWYWTVFKANGLVLYPPVSLVLNEGFASGTHGGRTANPTLLGGTTAGKAVTTFPELVGVSGTAFAAVRAALRRERSPARRLLRLVRSRFP